MRLKGAGALEANPSGAENGISNEMAALDLCRLRLCYDQMPTAFILLRSVCSNGEICELVCEYVNSAFERLEHIHRQDVIGRPVGELFPRTKTERILKYGNVALQGGKRQTQFYDSYLQKTMKAVCYQPEQGYCAILLEDVTEQQETAEQLRLSKERNRIAMQISSDIMYDYDICKNVIYNHRRTDNPEEAQILENVPESRILDGTVFLADADQYREMYERIRLGDKISGCTVRMNEADGEYRWKRITLGTFHFEEGLPIRAVGVVQDVDEQIRREQQLQRQAERDALTGMFNKGTAEEHIRRSLSKNDCPYALFLIDVDNFKQINDTLGHAFGDAVLSELAKRIQELFRENDIVGRTGGDEFMALVPSRDRGLLAKRAMLLCEHIRSGNLCAAGDAPISVSVGIALFPEHGGDFSQLYRNADVALYKAKERGKDTWHIYSGEQFSGYYARSEPTLANGTTEGSTLSEGEHLKKDFGGNVSEFVFRILYGSADQKQAIHSVLSLLARHYNMSRAYIFENTEGGRSCNNTYEWCAQGVEPLIGKRQKLPYEEVRRHEERFARNCICIIPDVNLLPAETRSLIHSPGVRSMVQIALWEGGRYRGYVGFDNCVNSLLLAQREIDDLSVAVGILSTFLLKQHALERAEKSLAILREVMDHLDAYVFVLNPETHQILFANRKVDELDVQAKAGDICHRVFCGRELPCAECPMHRLQEGASQMIETEYFNQAFTVPLVAKASWLRWTDGSPACMFYCTRRTE